ncbi:MAG: acyl-CoA thioesterase II [Deltaproteobacteria bacterium]|nr:acyl-CoA thioesterase II [Deltaproteobacteria bacterium]MBW2414650.1 acyl-CoA thioesterase II [Deltaproteobacteria bacterium]
MTQALKELIDLLDLEELEVNIFRGRSPQEDRQRVFGGQVLGQALIAAIRTVDEDDRIAHSMHAYFLRPGDPNIPILYDVDRIRDGRSFTTRRVVAIQHGRAIFNMSVSFQRAEQGLEHQVDMPDTPPPEEVPSFDDRVAEYVREHPESADEWMQRDRPIEQRFVDHDGLMTGRVERPPYQRVWLRASGALPDGLALHQCVLAYASDLSLLDTSILPHAINFGPELMAASLDHAMWFHHPFRMDDWVLYVQDSPASSGARGFNRGSVYTREGKLVASMTQEGLIRVIRPGAG